MTIYDYVWLFMTLYDQIWLWITMYIYMYDYVWLCFTMYDYVWLYMTMHYYVWLCTTSNREGSTMTGGGRVEMEGERVNKILREEKEGTQTLCRWYLCLMRRQRWWSLMTRMMKSGMLIILNSVLPLPLLDLCLVWRDPHLQ